MLVSEEASFLAAAGLLFRGALRGVPAERGRAVPGGVCRAEAGGERLFPCLLIFYVELAGIVVTAMDACFFSFFVACIDVVDVPAAVAGLVAGWA